jgi:signal-transduction protein with cAMP-binding, CBS, and nucleotidyltransferase domain
MEPGEVSGTHLQPALPPIKGEAPKVEPYETPKLSNEAEVKGKPSQVEVSSVRVSTPQMAEEAAVDYFKKTIANMRDHASTMLAEGQKIPDVFDFITGNYTSFLSAAAKLAEKTLAAKGKACPTAYAIGGLGSLARGEVSPFSDLDFILLVQEDTPEIRKYFEELLGTMRSIILGLGEPGGQRGGIQFCTGGLNPVYIKTETKRQEKGGSPQLLGTPSDMGSRALRTYRDRGEVTNPSAPLPSIVVALQQVGFVHGDRALVEQFVKERDVVYSGRDPGEVATIRQKKGLEFMQSGATHLETIGDLEKVLQKDMGYIDIKTTLLRPIQGTILGLCIYYGIEETNTLKAIDLLVKRDIINKDFGKKIKDVYCFGGQIRLKAQLAAKEEVDKVVAGGEARPKDYQLTPQEKLTLADCHRTLLALRLANNKFNQTSGQVKSFR